jgi:apolipoprotein N-acyltransferase
MRLRSLLMAGALAALSGAPGCKKKSDVPDCKAAASTYAQLVKEQIDRDTKDDESRRAQALSLIPSLKEEMAKACEKQKWSPATRTCIKNAQAAGDLPRCMPKKPESEPAAPVTPDTAAPGSTPPAPAEQPKSDG